MKDFFQAQLNILYKINILSEHGLNLIEIFPCSFFYLGLYFSLFFLLHFSLKPTLVKSCSALIGQRPELATSTDCEIHSLALYFVGVCDQVCCPVNSCYMLPSTSYRSKGPIDNKAFRTVQNINVPFKLLLSTLQSDKYDFGVPLFMLSDEFNIPVFELIPSQSHQP